MSDLTPSAPHSPPPPPSPPAAHVLQIRTKPGGIWTAIGLVAGLALFVVVFIVGIVFGVGVMVAGASMNSVVIEQTYREPPGRARDKIAILPIEGIINDSQAQFVRAGVDHILDDRRVKAVILRVDSPGGGVTASDQIWYEVERLKAKNLPVVASYGSLAASGGYYVSCAADHIIAEETCITGSIGVIAQIFTMQGLMDKVGIEPVTLVATGSPEKSVGNDIFRQWNEEDQRKWLGLLDEAHGIFTRRVRDARGEMFESDEALVAVANGSIYSATAALEKGLIDGIGYLDDAVIEAERRGGIAAGRARVVRITEPPSLFGNGLLLRERAGGSSSRSTLGAPAGLTGENIRGFVNDLSTPRAMYLMW